MPLFLLLLVALVSAFVSGGGAMLYLIFSAWNTHGTWPLWVLLFMPPVLWVLGGCAVLLHTLLQPFFYLGH